MKKLTNHDSETRSADLVTESVARLAALFPDAVAEGKVDLEVIKQIVGEAGDDEDEKFGLAWHGKRAARQIALTPSAGTLRPVPDQSSEWGATKNLMIEGDNLEVLKLLQKSYANQVQVIYIDPPYNTGQDFVYHDDFAHGIHNYLANTGQIDGEGAGLTSNPESSGRFHTDWLNMIYPRIRLGYSLLSSGGFMIVSIDDVEVANLKLVMREIFGEENEVATLVWDRNRKNDAKLFSVGHEYMLIFAKSKQALREAGLVLREPKAGIDEARELFDSLREAHGDDWTAVAKGWKEYYRALADEDPRKPLGRFTKVTDRGPFRDDGDISWPGGGGPTYEVLHPTTGRPCKVPRGGWVYADPEKFWQEVEAGRVAFGPDETTLPRQVRFLFEGDGQVMRSVNYSYAQTATLEFVELMGSRVFDNPKNWRDLARLIGYLSGADDLVVDYFAGAGSTGHAVYWQNAQDGMSRRFILVQLPEPLESSNRAHEIAAAFCEDLGVPANLAEITKERLRRAAEAVRREAPEVEGDRGFRVFRLDYSNIQAWEPDREDIEGSLLASVDHLKADRTEEDILYELLLKRGLPLTVPIEDRTVAGKTVHSVGAGTLFACLADTIQRTEVEDLALGISAWRSELQPVGDPVVVFRDSAFADDVAKTNLSAILEQHGMPTVRSL